jgi:heptosyltransferase-1
MRILVVRLGAMGDVLHAMPAVAALRSGFPAAHVAWIVERRWRPLLVSEDFPLSGPASPQRPLVEQVHVVDTRRWRKSPISRRTIAELLSACREVRGCRYDLAIDFQGSTKSAVIAAVSRAAERLGFAHPREAPARLFYTRRIETEGSHVVTQNFALVRALSSSISNEVVFELPRDQSAEQHCETELSRLRIRDFALLSPGAGWPAKQWPPERFGDVARALGARGLRSLVNVGPGEEAMARAAVERSQGAAVALSANLPQLIAFTRLARFFLGGDTGPMHLAAALRVPVVALFGPTDPLRNGPFGTEHSILRNPLSVISYSHRRQNDAGLQAITSAEVIAAAESLLDRTEGAS